MVVPKSVRIDMLIAIVDMAATKDLVMLKDMATPFWFRCEAMHLL